MIKGYYDVIKCKLNIPTIQSKLQMKEIIPSTEEQYIIPDEGYDGLASAIIKAVTNEIDPNILPENIKLGKSILGIQGNLEPDKPDQNKTVVPSDKQQIIRADIGYELAQVTVEPIPDETSELDTQDTALSTQQTRIDELESALDNKIALDLADATSDADAVASDIAQGKTAYVDGVKLTGTLQVVEPVVLPDGLKFGDEASTSTDYSWLKNVDTSNMTSMYRMFGGCSNARVIDVSNFNTSNVTGMGRMFENCFYVKNLDVSNFNTSNVTDLSTMFAQCSGLLSLDVSNFDTHNARNTYTMFNGCGKITSLDVSNFDLQKVVNANGMFSQCSLLENIDVSELKLTTATAMSNMFVNCRSLSNNSLNSILAMCIDAISLASTNKTLKYIGLSQTQAETCKTLSNWDAFVAAGWSTGYES